MFLLYPLTKGPLLLIFPSDKRRRCALCSSRRRRSACPAVCWKGDIDDWERRRTAFQKFRILQSGKDEKKHAIKIIWIISFFGNEFYDLYFRVISTRLIWVEKPAASLEIRREELVSKKTAFAIFMLDFEEKREEIEFHWIIIMKKWVGERPTKARHCKRWVFRILLILRDIMLF